MLFVKNSRVVQSLIALCVFSASVAQAQTAPEPDGVFNSGVYNVGFGNEIDSPPAFSIDAGFHVEKIDLRRSFILGPKTEKIFATNAALRLNMPVTTSKVFLPIVQDISAFIENQENLRGHSVEKDNGLSNWALAIKITRLAFCFGTDPRGITAQIKKESTFDRKRVSSTGAVGFTQMTGVAIDEVNDQLGNRGAASAKPENIPYLMSAISCYLGGGQKFVPMFADRTIPAGKLVNKNSVYRAAAKKWLRASIDRDLIYGQITLKVLLAYAFENGKTGAAAYIDAFRRYNGEPHGGAQRYSIDVMNTIKKFGNDTI